MRPLVGISLVQTALLAGVAVGAARAADPAVELLVEASQVFVREPFSVRVVISNFRECEPFTFPALPDCDVEALGPPSESRQISIIGGVRQDWRSRVHTYELTPRRAGTLEIPPIEILVDGVTLRTRAALLTVRESDAQSLLSVRVTCGTRRAYVGQQLDLQLEIWVKPARTASGPASALQMWRQVLGRRSTWGPFPIPDKFSNRQRDGEACYVYHSQVRYIADRPGPLNFDDVAIAMEYPVRFGRDIFNDDTPTATRRLRARAEVDPVEVLPLPQEGRPPGFSGAVGRYTVHASASPTSVRVGDPIELTIDVGGEGPLEALPPPALTQQPALTQAFRVPTETLAGSTQRGQRRFTQVIRAKRPDVTDIPPIEYPYFDPHLGQYVVARSEAIPINVTAAETLSSADLTDSAPTARSALRPGSEPVDGLRGIEVNAPRLLASAPLVRPAHVVAATVAPP
ncbi:MAG: BatD family protein, partial [Phycisphaerae bacterium]|nr:BatD family protein [Phycisphaerae bacterium]